MCREAVAELRTHHDDPGSPLSSLVLERTQEEPTSQSLYRERKNQRVFTARDKEGIQGFPAPVLSVRGFPRGVCQYSFVWTSLSMSGPPGMAETVRDAQQETHTKCPKPWLGLGCGDRWVVIFTLLLLLF